jgi:hypothetical protein
VVPLVWLRLLEALQGPQEALLPVLEVQVLACS